jgi:hypothetical protein
VGTGGIVAVAGVELHNAMEPSEFSESGNPIYRYNPREKPFELVTGDINPIQLMDRHIKAHLGEPAWVFHEIVSDLVHLDVHVVAPTAGRNFYTLLTSGMSARAMKVPEGCENLSYAELMISLPPDWPLRQEDFSDERNYWPIRLLKTLGRMPHEYDTWLGDAHTIPNGDPPEPYADNTRFCGAILAPPLMVPEGFRWLKVSPELEINFFALLPLYQEEMDLKLKRGAEALFDRFDKHRVTELVQINRKNVAKKLFGFF